MAHKCKHNQAGKDSCAEHILTKEGVRFRFKAQMIDVIGMDQISEWHDLMLATMLPSTKGVPLDDRPQWYIDKVSNGRDNSVS